MKIAMQITKENLDGIAVLNAGVRPHPDTLVQPTWFIWDSTDDAYCEIIAEEEFPVKYKLVGIAVCQVEER